MRVSPPSAFLEIEPNEGFHRAKIKHTKPGQWSVAWDHLKEPVTIQSERLWVRGEGMRISDESAPLELTLGQVGKAWDAITHAISREKMSVATYLQEGSPYELNGSKLTISFPKEATFQKESLEQKDNLKLVEKIFGEKLKATIIVDFKIIDNHKSQEDEPFIKSALQTFKGKVVSKWHNE